MAAVREGWRRRCWMYWGSCRRPAPPPRSAGCWRRRVRMPLIRKRRRVANSTAVMPTFCPAAIMCSGRLPGSPRARQLDRRAHVQESGRPEKRGRPQQAGPVASGDHQERAPGEKPAIPPDSSAAASIRLRRPASGRTPARAARPVRRRGSRVGGGARSRSPLDRLGHSRLQFLTVFTILSVRSRITLF